MTVRPRWKLALLIAIVIPLGLASRSFGQQLPAFIAEYAGDTLWALMVYWLFAFVFPDKSAEKIGLSALVFSFGIEFSQLWQADWLNAVRDTIPGKLVLGRGFLWSDLLCYTVGILAGIGIDYWHLFPKKAVS